MLFSILVLYAVMAVRAVKVTVGGA